MMLVFVKESGSTFFGGVKVRLGKDEAWDGNDPVVKARPDLFVDRPTVVRSSVEKAAAPVESASAVPGEKRSVAKKSAAKKKD